MAAASGTIGEIFFMAFDPEGPGIFGPSNNPAIRFGGMFA